MTQCGNSTRQAESAKSDRADQAGHSGSQSNLASACLMPCMHNIVLMMGLLTATIPQFTAVRQVRMEEYLEDLSEEAHVLIQEPEARAEAMHSAQHQSMVCVILGFLP